MPNILLIGSGAREHALALAINRSEIRHQLYCLASHNNPGISPLCKEIHIGSLTDISLAKQLADTWHIDFAIIGPEASLAAGIVDALHTLNIPSIGPKAELAQIETSKVFTRQLLEHYGINGQPSFKFFETTNGLADYLKKLGNNYVIKADGLMGGKGVKVAGDHLSSHDAALAYASQLLENNQSVLVEEKLYGEEFSLLSFTDGYHVSHMPIVQDHKRAFVDDKGPNTGGMGAYSCADHRLPFLSQLEVRQAQEINQAAIAALRQASGNPYQGILYGGYMLTAQGVKLIEFNARFGDPEAINLLHLLECDFIALCEAILKGTLNQFPVTFKNLASVCKYVVPEGYPESSVKAASCSISKLQPNTQVYYGAVSALPNQALLMHGSRALALLGTGNSVGEAEQAIHSELSLISGPVFYRDDIGTQALLDKKITHMQQIKMQVNAS